MEKSNKLDLELLETRNKLLEAQLKHEKEYNDAIIQIMREGLTEPFIKIMDIMENHWNRNDNKDDEEYPGGSNQDKDYMFRNGNNTIFEINEKLATNESHYIVSAMNILVCAQLRFGNDFDYYLEKVKDFRCKQIKKLKGDK